MNFLKDFFERLVCWLVLTSNNQDLRENAHLEVERKFRLSELEFNRLPEKLIQLGFKECNRVLMTDTFLPTKNDKDMLRVRVEAESGKLRTFLTSKTWVVTVDGGKERKETEREIKSFVGRFLLAAGRCLNNAQLLSLSKRRQTFTGTLAGMPAVASLDLLTELGQYSGHYLEVEILIPIDHDVTLAREQIAAFVRQLLGESSNPVVFSYKEMLKLSLQKS